MQPSYLHQQCSDAQEQPCLVLWMLNISVNQLHRCRIIEKLTHGHEWCHLLSAMTNEHCSSNPVYLSCNITYKCVLLIHLPNHLFTLFKINVSLKKMTNVHWLFFHKTKMWDKKLFFLKVAPFFYYLKIGSLKKIVVTRLEQKIQMQWIDYQSNHKISDNSLFAISSYGKCLNVLPGFLGTVGPLMSFTLCPVLFLLSCLTLPSPFHTARLSLSLLSAQTEWHLSLPGMYCAAGTERGKQRGRKELKEGASAFLHHSGTPVTNQPTRPPPTHCSLCCKWIKWDQTVCVSWCLGGQGQAITCSHKLQLALLHAALYTCAVTTMTQNHLSPVLFLY